MPSNSNEPNLEKEVLEIADYLGCNGAELWSELEPLFNQATQKAFNKGYREALNQANKENK